MHFSSQHLTLLGLVAIGHVNSLPAQSDTVIKALAKYPAAMALCSNHLQMPQVRDLAATKTTADVGVITSGVLLSTVTETTAITTCILSGVNKRDVSQQNGLPGFLLSLSSDELAFACSCLFIGVTSTGAVAVPSTTGATLAKSVVTVTSTSTHISCPTPRQCRNQGLEFAHYNNSQGENQKTLTYELFDPSVYNMKPNFEGATPRLGGFEFPAKVELRTLYKVPNVNSSYFVLNHCGYIFAALSGSYTFTISTVDDAAFIWLGPKAYSDWTKSNADVRFSRGDVVVHRNAPSTIVQLNEGDYYPIRILFVQAQNDAHFNVTIQGPDGTVFLNSSTEASPYLVQYSCDDGITASRFPRWYEQPPY